MSSAHDLATRRRPGAARVSDQERVQAAWNELNLVLGFFPRIDTRLSAVLALNPGMLALVGGRWPAPEHLSFGLIAIAAVFAVPLCWSFYHLWIAIVPNRNGGTNSLISFRSIAGMRESDFRDQFMKLSPRELACDLLEQTWRNAKVLEANSTRCAARASAWPWRCPFESGY